MKKLSLILLVVLLFLGFFPSENARIRLQSQALLNHPLPEVWQVISDLSLAHHYWPGALKTSKVDFGPIREGASRTLLLESDKTLQETVIEWDEGSGYVMAWDQPSNDWRFHDVEIRYHIEADDELGKKTDLAITVTFRPSYGLLGKWLLSAYLTTVWQGWLDNLTDSIQYFYDTRSLSESASKS